QGRIVFADALGDAVREPELIPAKLETVYDLASLTKPVVTGLLCARRVENGQLALDEPVAKDLREFDRSDKRRITLRHLLTHTSGLPAWRPLFILARENPARALDAIAAEQLEHEPGERVVYSDLGFIALGFLLQRQAQTSLAQLAQHEIISALDLKHT